MFIPPTPSMLASAVVANLPPFGERKTQISHLQHTPPFCACSHIRLQCERVGWQERGRHRLVRRISSHPPLEREAFLSLSLHLALSASCSARMLAASTATSAVESQLFEIRKHSNGDTKAQGNVSGSGNGSGFS